MEYTSLAGMQTPHNKWVYIILLGNKCYREKWSRESWGRMERTLVILDREALPDKLICEQRSEESVRGRAFQTEEITSAKALRQKCALLVPGTIQRPLWWEWSARWRVTLVCLGREWRLGHPGSCNDCHGFHVGWNECQWRHGIQESPDLVVIFIAFYY